MVTTSLLDDITQKVAALPVELQRETLDFIEWLIHKARNGAAAPSAAGTEQAAAADEPPVVKSIFGLWGDRHIGITNEEITEARREMWGSFPREFPQ